LIATQKLNVASMRHLKFLITLFAVALPLAHARADETNQPPVQLTASQDHQRVMDLLHMTSFRRITIDNYDESKANPYPNLPDPLTMNDGTKVTTPDQWWNQRRPEIAELLDREIYGRTPAVTPKVTWEIVSVTNRVLTNATSHFNVIEKHLVGHVDDSSYTNISVNIQLMLTLPANAAGPSPVIMLLTFGPGRNGFFGRDFFPPWQAEVLSNGWGLATLNTYSVQADGAAGFSGGIIGLCNKGQPRKLDDWGVLKAWAWAASRSLDYLETDPAVDATRVGLEGHSRWGKTAIVAMAYDQRFAIVYSSSSGFGGAHINRRNYGEVLENAAWSDAYHWYAGNMLKYAGPLNPGDLPVDGHELIAMCAPRPVFIGGGSTDGSRMGDGHADPRGEFMAAVAAGPVYRLLGKKDLGTDIFPPAGTPLIDGDLAFREHNGGHTDYPNWPTFLSFAERYFKGPGLKPPPGS
jgi:hypothetical protein